ncbi:MAG: Tetratricopeptide 2 repeat protein [Verrucomicrobiales bacterium]|nr:Tetratricopeptide 2 repeat protein [Verrucomicrobiales bacterium]
MWRETKNFYASEGRDGAYSPIESGRLGLDMKTLRFGCAVLGGTLALVLAAVSGCGRSNLPKSQMTPSTSGPLVQARDLALTPHPGDDRLDREIRELQKKIRSNQNTAANLDKLGWMYVLKARTAFDPGFFKQAEACAEVLKTEFPGGMEFLLLKGHVLQNLHHFKEAEPLARELVTQRGLPFDFGLLGDVLMEQGRLPEATAAYQKMIDMKPDMQGYARAAQMRWLKGNLQGAREAMRMAASASSARDPEGAAWAHTRLGFYEWQLGAIDEATMACETALALQKDYPPALLLEGRMFLAKRKSTEAIVVLKKAAEANPLPEYQWTLLEALLANNETSEARRVETALKLKGAAADPRTFALFLATHSENTNLAALLAEKELKERQDVFTYDALAWAQAASGNWIAAYSNSRKALAEGTRDARLLLHGAFIAAGSGHKDEAEQLLAEAGRFADLLLPSERKLLELLEKRAGDPQS